MCTNLDALKRILDQLPPGPITDSAKIEAALAAAWPEIKGSDAEATSARKLIGRMESIDWQPPILKFLLERHGETVQGSVYAPVHRWKVDVLQGTASCSIAGRRQVKPKDKKLHVSAFAEELAPAIV